VFFAIKQVFYAWIKLLNKFKKYIICVVNNIYKIMLLASGLTEHALHNGPTHRAAYRQEYLSKNINALFFCSENYV
jgi:hypothetical protein